MSWRGKQNILNSSLRYIKTDFRCVVTFLRRDYSLIFFLKSTCQKDLAMRCCPANVMTGQKDFLGCECLEVRGDVSYRYAPALKNIGRHVWTIVWRFCISTYILWPILWWKERIKWVKWIWQRYDAHMIMYVYYELRISKEEGFYDVFRCLSYLVECF